MQAIDPAGWQKFVDILGGDEESIQEVGDLFLEESQAVGKALLEAIEERDAETTRRMAHRLKSSSRQLGAIDLSNAAQALEEAGSEGNMELAEELAPGFQRLLDEARAAVAKRIVD